MAKDRRKKKYFQGMGQYRPEMAASQENGPAENQVLEEYKYVKGDLVKTIVIVVVILAFFAGLTILDRQTSTLTQIAQKVTEIFVK